MAKATRVAYGDALAEFGGDERIVVLDADLTKSTMTATFGKEYPDRLINCGIAEGNMMTIAAGMATCGHIVFASTFAVFASGRAFEQVRNSICYPNLNVKIGATHAGITVGEDGASHQSICDIALMRALPNMTVISPADATEARLAVKAAIDHQGPVYLRFGRLTAPDVFDDTYKFQIGKGVQLKQGNDVTLIATGMLVSEAIAAHELLQQQGINARVINISTIKPIDKDIIIEAASQTSHIFTLEEHNIIGGLGSAVAEVLCENHPAPLTRIGMNDEFGRSGKAAELLDYYGLTGAKIAQRVHSVMSAQKA